MPDSLKKAVFKIEVYRQGNVAELGTGFIVGKQDDNLVIVTANHVIVGADSIFVTPFGRRTRYKTEWTDGSEMTDIAILGVADGIPVYWPSYLLSPDFGDKVNIIRPNSGWEGYMPNPKGYIRTVSALSITLRNLIASSGDSGSPLFHDGNIIGMISKTGDSRSDEVTIVSFKAILAALEEWKVKCLLKSESKTIVAYIPPPDNKPVLKEIHCTKVYVEGACSGNSNLLTDNNLSTGWKCSGNGNNYLYFYFDKKYSISEFSLFLDGNLINPTEEIPDDGHFRIETPETNIGLKKIMYSKSEKSGGTWVTFKLKQNIVTDHFYLHSPGSTVYTTAIYEISIKGYEL